MFDYIDLSPLFFGTGYLERGMDDDWTEALRRFEERTAERRAKAKEHEQQAEEVVRKAQKQESSHEEPAV